MSLAALLVAAILAATPSEYDHPAASRPAPAERLPPGPLVVESASEAPAGVVGIEPGVARVRVEPGLSVQPEFLITNGAGSALDLGLTVTPVVPAADGTPRVAETSDDSGSAVPSAASWVALPASGLHLDPGEHARLRPTISVPAQAEPGGYATAIRVATKPGSIAAEQANAQVVTFLLVEVTSISGRANPGVVATPALARSGLAGAEARVRLDAEQSGVVAGRLTVGGWWGGRVVDVSIPPTVVLLAVPRTQQVGFRAPLLPGPYHLVAWIETSSGETLTARATAWLWNPLATLIGLLVLLVVPVAVVTRGAVAGRGYGSR